jgi:hypothetical protein
VFQDVFVRSKNGFVHAAVMWVCVSEAGRHRPLSFGLRCKSPMMVMPPAVMVAAIPTVVVAAPPMMPPPMPMSVPAFDLNNCPIGCAEHRGCCCGHGRRCHGWREHNGTAGKSDHKQSFHLVPPRLRQRLRSINFVLPMLTERCIH